MELPDGLVCTLCAQLLHVPRIYENCGHCFCEICMLKHDNAALDAARCGTDYPTFSCPMCRASSLRRWFERPINVLVAQMVCEQPGHSQRAAEVAADLEAWLATRASDVFGVLRPTQRAPRDRPIDLARLARHARTARAQELYATMVPVLTDAAERGTSRVTFIAQAREINCVVDVLARLLYAHGIHSVHSTIRETTVHLTNDNLRWDTEFVNPLYDAGPVDAWRE